MRSCDALCAVCHGNDHSAMKRRSDRYRITLFFIQVNDGCGALRLAFQLEIILLGKATDFSQEIIGKILNQAVKIANRTVVVSA